MGTRHLVLVYYKGHYHIAQYGQWDGYPSGQGITILRFIRDAQNLTKLRAVLDIEGMLYEPTKDQMQTWYDEWCKNRDPEQKVYPPGVSRDTGAEILEFIANATEPVPILKEDIQFIADSFCEWAYVVDLDKNIIEVYSNHMFPPTVNGDTGSGGGEDIEGGDRFQNMDCLKGADCLPPLVGKFSFDELPDEPDFISSLGEGSGE
ncbi:hypothetical protein BJ170DRAFT_633652 [Xylariales sp. AK1849]|nr:hypothetical protein BJ170DRAFT_633652 [Xylariales sp. AK1849]